MPGKPPPGRVGLPTMGDVCRRLWRWLLRRDPPAQHIRMQR